MSDQTLNHSPSTAWLPGKGGQLRTHLRDGSGATAEIYRHGAHLTSWRSATGKEWIFTSDNAVFDGKTAIRGGVPVIFPQFNAFGEGPRHGFARNAQWQNVGRTDDSVILALEHSEATSAWPHRFRAEFHCGINQSQLNLHLTIHNLDDQPFQFTCALHTYFKIDNLTTSRVQGLRGWQYWDNDGSEFSQRRIFADDELTFNDAIDRVFFNYQQPLVLHRRDASLKIEHNGFQDVVIWNPGKAAATGISDMADHEYQHMLCIEAAQIDNPVVLQPGESWEGKQICQEL